MPRTKEWLRAAPLVAPGALAVYFGFNSGGYFPGAPAVVAVVLAVALALRLVTARHPLAGMSPLLLAAGGAMAAFACWALVSAGWSDAAGRALLEYDRALCYLLALIAFGSLGYTPHRLAVMLRWLAVGFFVICAAGVIVRTLPDVWTVDPGVATDPSPIRSPTGTPSAAWPASRRSSCSTSPRRSASRGTWPSWRPPRCPSRPRRRS